MANIDCDVYKAQFVDSPPTIQKSSVVDGRLKRTVAKITGAGEAIATVIRICRPPKGARLSSLSKILFEDFGAGCTLSVGVGIAGDGTAASAACFKAATSIAAVGNFNLDLLAGVDYVFDGKTDLNATVGGAVLGTGKKLVAEIIYANAN